MKSDEVEMIINESDFTFSGCLYICSLVALFHVVDQIFRCCCHKIYLLATMMVCSLRQIQLSISL